MGDRGVFITSVGLCLALLGPAALALLSTIFLVAERSLGTALLAQLEFVFICACVLTIVLRGEHRTLSSVGLQPFRWQSIAWGGAFAAFLVWIYSPLLAQAMAFAKIPWFTEGLAKLAAYPLWFLVFAIVIGGAAEEFLYRGYAVERLAALTGSYWIAGLLSVLVSGLAHVPMWGWPAALTTVVSGALGTAFYVWRRESACKYHRSRHDGFYRHCASIASCREMMHPSLGRVTTGFIFNHPGFCFPKNVRD
jgi:membrane protease YdiL (CAAX protease family)